MLAQLIEKTLKEFGYPNIKNRDDSGQSRRTIHGWNEDVVIETSVEGIKNGIRDLLDAAPTDEKRLEILDELSSIGYCLHCGRPLDRAEICHCENEE